MATTESGIATKSATIRDLMTQQVWCCTAGDSLETAARLMWEHDLGCLPVIEADRHLVGMITDRDVAMAAYTRGRALREIRVSETMARQLVLTRSDEALTGVLELMESAQVRRIPVVDSEGRLEGIFTASDLAREGHRQHSRRRRTLSPGAVLKTLAEVCRPRSS